MVWGKLRARRIVKQYGRVITLAVLAVAGQAIAYALSVVLARRLGVEGYEAYAVASAAFVLMVTEALQGIEKYTLRRVGELSKLGCTHRETP